MRTLCRLAIFLIILTLVRTGYAQTFLGFNTFERAWNGKINWSDLDSDGDLDVIYNGTPFTGPTTTRVYKNTAGVFDPIDTDLPDIEYGSISTADFDNDGDLDAMVCGRPTPFTKIAELYRNDGSFAFTLHASFTGLVNGSVVWADFDNDRDLDFIMTGTDDEIPNALPREITEVWLNNAGTFSKVNTSGLPGCAGCNVDCADVNGDGLKDVIMVGFSHVSADPYITGYFLGVPSVGSVFFEPGPDLGVHVLNGVARWSDLDRDGDPDAIVCGSGQAGNETHVFLNERGTLTRKQNAQLPGVGTNFFGGLDLADFDNDGFPDVVLGGRTGTNSNPNNLYHFFKNNGDGSFSSPTTLFMGIGGVNSASLDIGDYDNDGDLDVCFMGLTPIGPFTGISLNQMITNVPAATNTLPGPPSSTTFNERFFRDDFFLNWGTGTDSETPANALLYNLYLRDGSNYLSVPPVNLTTGYVWSESATGHSRKFRLNGFSEGTYTWAVQSVDGAKSGSIFSSERSFYFIHGPRITAATLIDPTHLKLDWQDLSSVETSFTVESSTLPATGFSVLQNGLAPNTTTFTDNHSFVIEVPHYYRVYNANATVTSGYDSIQVVMMQSPATLAAAAPVFASKVSLSWVDRSNFESGYVVERKTAVGSVYAAVATLDANVVSFLDQAVAEGTAYNYRVRAINQNGSSDFSNVVNVTTNARPVPGVVSKTILEDHVLIFSALDFTSAYTDVDADPLVSISITELPASGVLKQGSTVLTIGSVVPAAQLGTISFAPVLNFAGPLSFRYSVFDGKDASLSTNAVNLSVTNVNDAPIASSFIKVTPEDTQLQFAASDFIFTSSDVDAGDAIENISINTMPNGTMKLGSANLVVGDIVTTAQLSSLAFLPAQDFFGQTVLRFDVGDGEARSAVAEVQITVLPVNDAPFIEVVADQAVNGNQLIIVPIAVTDVDTNVSNVFLTAHSSDVTVVKPERLTIIGNGTLSRSIRITVENKVGESIITLGASDGSRSFSRTFKVTVLTVVVGLDDQRGQLHIYPNPVTNRLNIHINQSLVLPCGIKVFDALGRAVAFQLSAEQETTLETSGWAPGLYLIELEAGDGSLHHIKVVKSH